MTIIIALLVFGVLVIIHELGHFLVAKAFDTRIYEFAVGMGPTVLKKKKGETIYSLHAIPVGGFVRFDAYQKPEYKTIEEQQNDKNEYEENFYDERSLMNKNPWKRILIMFAGSFMNLVLAVVLFAGLFIYVGQPTTTIGEVVKGMPAYEAGLEVGDKILKVDNKEVIIWEDIVEKIGNSKNKNVNLTIEKSDGQIREIDLTKIIEEDRGKIGITPKLSHGIISGVKNAFITTGVFIVSMVDTVVQLFTGRADINEFAGPVGIITIVDQAVSVGVKYLINLTAMLSLNLAVLNLLPLPALDGGRILITFLEIISGGRKVPQKVETIIHVIGFVLLFSFMIFLTFKDVGRLIGG
ncbi:MAG: RIP metalloprotease RseP [Filifactoraceae bacterium]